MVVGCNGRGAAGRTRPANASSYHTGCAVVTDCLCYIQVVAQSGAHEQGLALNRLCPPGFPGRSLAKLALTLLHGTARIIVGIQ